MRNLKQKLAQIIEDLKPYDPEKVILFGSYARGEAGKESDVDLLIVKETEKPRYDRYDDISRLLYKRKYYGTDKHIKGLDFRVYTPQKLKERFDLGDFFIEEVLDQGKVIYEKK